MDTYNDFNNFKIDSRPLISYPGRLVLWIDNISYKDLNINTSKGGCYCSRTFFDDLAKDVIGYNYVGLGAGTYKDLRDLGLDNIGLTISSIQLGYRGRGRFTLTSICFAILVPFGTIRLNIMTPTRARLGKRSTVNSIEGLIRSDNTDLREISYELVKRTLYLFGLERDNSGLYNIMTLGRLTMKDGFEIVCEVRFRDSCLRGYY